MKNSLTSVARALVRDLLEFSTSKGIDLAGSWEPLEIHFESRGFRGWKI